MPRARPERPVCQTVGGWLRANYGRDVTAALTGTDVRALSAFIHTLALYVIGRPSHLAESMGSIVVMMQPSTRWLAKAAIPMVMDWPDEEKVWKVMASVTPDLRRATTPDRHRPKGLGCGHVPRPETCGGCRESLEIQAEREISE